MFESVSTTIISVVVVWYILFIVWIMTNVLLHMIHTQPTLCENYEFFEFSVITSLVTNFVFLVMNRVLNNMKCYIRTFFWIFNIVFVLFLLISIFMFSWSLIVTPNGLKELLHCKH